MLLKVAIITFCISYSVSAQLSKIHIACEPQIQEKLNFQFNRTLEKLKDGTDEVERVVRNDFNPQPLGMVKDFLEDLFEKPDKDYVLNNTEIFENRIPREISLSRIENNRSISPYDVIIYCTNERLRHNDVRLDKSSARKNTVAYVDTTWGDKWDEQTYQGCFGNNRTVSAYAGGPNEDTDIPSGPSRIWICPWFLDLLEKDGWSGYFQSIGLEQTDPLRYDPFGLTLLRVLGYTWAGGRLRDPESGGSPFSNRPNFLIDWKGCVEIKDKTNAQSYAFLINMIDAWKTINLYPDKTGRMTRTFRGDLKVLGKYIKGAWNKFKGNFSGCWSLRGRCV